MCNGMINNQLHGPVVLDERLTRAREFSKNDLRDLLDDIPLVIRQNVYFKSDGASAHFNRFINHFSNRFSQCWIGRRCFQN